VKLVNDLDTNNVGVGVELELLLLDGSVSWVGGVEDVIKFLKSAVLGLWGEEISDPGLDQTPNHEDEVSLPLDLFESLWETELVDEGTKVDEETGESHSLGAHLEGEDLDWVKSLKWGPSERVDRLEDIDHNNHGN